MVFLFGRQQLLTTSTHYLHLHDTHFSNHSHPPSPIYSLWLSLNSSASSLFLDETVQQPTTHWWPINNSLVDNQPFVLILRCLCVCPQSSLFHIFVSFLSKNTRDVYICSQRCLLYFPCRWPHISRFGLLRRWRLLPIPISPVKLSGLHSMRKYIKPKAMPIRVSKSMPTRASTLFFSPPPSPLQLLQLEAPL